MISVTSSICLVSWYQIGLIVGSVATGLDIISSSSNVWSIVSDILNLLIVALKILSSNLDLVLQCRYCSSIQQEVLQIALLILCYCHWVFPFFMIWFLFCFFCDCSWKCSVLLVMLLQPFNYLINCFNSISIIFATFILFKLVFPLRLMFSSFSILIPLFRNLISLRKCYMVPCVICFQLVYYCSCFADLNFH